MYSNLSLFADYIEESRKLSLDVSRYQRAMFNRRSQKGDLADSSSKLQRAFLTLFDSSESRLPDEGFNAFLERKKITPEDGLDFASEVMTNLHSVRNVDEVENPEKWASDAHSLLNDLDEFKLLKEFTKGDADIAALAASKFLSEMATDIAKLRDIVQQQEESGEGEGEGGQSEGEGEGEGENSEKKEQLDKERKKIENNIKMKSGQLCEQLTKEAAEIKESLNDLEENEGGGLGKGWGDEETEKQTENGEERWDLVKKIARNKMFREVLKLAGRLKRIGSGLKRESYELDEEIDGIELGNDLTKIMEDELMIMADPEIEDLFWMDFIEESCVQYKMKGKEPQARGPYVVMLDCSGSMWGEPHELTRAIGTAYMIKAKEDRRDCDVLNFNRRVVGHYQYLKSGSSSEIGVGRGNDSFKCERNFSKLVLENINLSCGGGTSFDNVFNHAFDHTKALKEEKGDIIFVTDDGARVSETVMKRIEEFKSKGGRIFTYVINGGYCSQSLKDISERVINLDALANKESMLKALSEPMREL